MSSLLWIAVGAFAIGTEGFVLAGLLPAIASDLGVSVPLAGQLVTVFSLTYAVGSPVLAMLTGSLGRRRLLMGSMSLFALGNVLAAGAHGYATLLAARVTMALAASAFMPAASGYAAATAAPERRGRALSVIYTGLTLATVIGVPLGVLVGGRFGWRCIFGGVAALAITAVAGIGWALGPVASTRAATFPERLAVARRPEVVGALALTALALASTFTIYTYLAPFLDQAAGLAGPGVALVLLLFGLGGAAGNLAGGLAADRIGSRRLLSGIFGALSLIFFLLSLAPHLLPAGPAAAVVVGLVLTWGLVGWAFPSVQQASLVRLDPRLAPVTLSLNASATYLGISVGAVLGSLVVAHRHVLDVGWLGGGCALLGLLLVQILPRATSARTSARSLSTSDPWVAGAEGG